MVKADLLQQYTQVEYTLLTQYALMCTMIGLMPSRAFKKARTILDTAIEESREEGGYYLPRNFGDIILGQAASDESAVNEPAERIRKDLPRKRAEDVRDEDIRWWWNLSDVERRMMLKYDDACRMALTMRELRLIKCNSEKETVRRTIAAARRLSPVYGNPGDAPHAGDDRPLPHELKNRVTAYLQKKQITIDACKDKIADFSSLNAFIRHEIRSGNL